MRILILLIVVLCTDSIAEEVTKFNLSFEQLSDGTKLPDGWLSWGDYDINVDKEMSLNSHIAKISRSKNSKSFGSIVYQIPAHYQGSVIKLEGKMKIERVAKGYAGLLLRIDGKPGILAFDNMKAQNIKGSKGWQNYSISLNYPDEAESIFVGGLLAGEGVAWFDDLVVTIDGKDIQTLKEYQRPVLNAEKDKEFDEGSNFFVTDLNDKQVKNLTLLARVWGFLKYHHPAIAKGNYNWDYELFRVLPEFSKIKKHNKRDAFLIEWINSLGPISPCKTCSSDISEAVIKPDLKWIHKSQKKLKKALLHIYHNRSQEQHFYIDLVPNVFNPIFKNENAYANMTYPDPGFRLLALFRYWNAIQYFFPYKNIMDQDWNTQLEKYIPVFLDAKDELAYELALLQLIAHVQDTHANLSVAADKLDEWIGLRTSVLKVKFIEQQLVVTGYHDKDFQSQTQLKIGDVITHINDKSIKEIVKEKIPYYPASNRAAQLRNISLDLLKSNDKTIDIRYNSDGVKNLSEQLKLYTKDQMKITKWYAKTDEPSYKILSDNIGYVTLASITAEDVELIKKELKNTQAIIIDIRNYPATFVVFSLGSFFTSDTSAFVKFSRGHIDHPGLFTFTDVLDISNSAENYQGQLIVLVNEYSQSQSEYTAMAFRAGDNTTVIGSTTAGADGNVSKIALPGGLQSGISGIGVFYPDGIETQRVGIVPDIEIKPTIKGIKQGRDEPLEAAIEHILKNKNK